jgi:hypothetical protein
MQIEEREREKKKKERRSKINRASSLYFSFTPIR